MRITYEKVNKVHVNGPTGILMVNVVQLVRTLGCDPRCRKFESCRSHHHWKYSSVGRASPFNDKAIGSNPIGTTKLESCRHTDKNA